MIQTLKKNIALLITAVVVALSAGLMVPALSSAAQSDLNDSLSCGANNLGVSKSTGCESGNTSADSDIDKLIENIVNIFSVIVGVIAVVMIIIGGFRYVTSGGDSSNVTAAKNTIMYAIIGLIIVALAQIIVRFVLNQSNSISS
jgi:cytochrome bd-type quinol oxidase subunit 2